MSYGYLTWSALVLFYVVVSEIGATAENYQTVEA